MPNPDERATGRPCEDCGGLVVAGQEPVTAEDEPELVAKGIFTVGSEWCTNLECPSNYGLRGLHRVGVNDYLCLDCSMALSTPISVVVAHRRAHRGQSDSPGTYTYN